MTTTTTTTAIDPRPCFAAAVATATAVMDGVRSDQMDDPTPCDGFTVGDLHEHLVEVLHRTIALGRGEDPFALDLATDGAWAAAVAGQQAAWADDAVLDLFMVLPWEQAPGRDILAGYVSEVLVHAWDLATATGQRPDWDQEAAELGLAFMRRTLPAGGRQAMFDVIASQMPAEVAFVPPFAEAVAVPEDAPAIAPTGGVDRARPRRRLGRPAPTVVGVKVRFAVAPGPAHPAGLGPQVDALEAAGFDGIWLSDVPLAPIVDPIVGLAFAAGRTRRLKLGANLVPLGRNPLLLAKELAQLDQLSEGRLLLSFVPGLGQAGERAALGVASGDRGVVLEEVLALLRRWWAGETVTATLGPWIFEAVAPPGPPVQRPLEVWLGGVGPKALDRVGRVADGWLGAAVTPTEAGAARARIEAAAAAAGRVVDPEHHGLSIAYAREAVDDAELAGLRARRPDLDPTLLVPVGRDGLRSLIGRLVDEGLSKFVVRPVAAVASWGDELAWLADAVLDLQT